MHRSNGRRRFAYVIGIVALAGGLASAQSPSGAALGDGAFEIDGDLTGTLDWVGAASGSSATVICPPAIGAMNCGIDLPTGQGDDSFGNGTKEDTAVPAVVDGSIPNNKSDLTRFYVATNKQTVGGSPNDFLYLAWERVQEPSGTTNMDFEFNQSRVVSTNAVTPVRTKGDVLIKFDLSQGGTNPTFGMHVWQDGSTGFNGACEASNRKPCWGAVQALDGTVAAGRVNTVDTSDPIAPNAPRTLSPRTFGEAAINLTAARVLDPARCTSFGAAYLKSRSSDSFTAAVKDFIAPIPVEVSNCQPATVNLVKYDSKGTAGDTSDDVLLAGATLQLWQETNSTAGVQTTGTTDTLLLTCTSNASACSGYQVLTSGTYYGVESAAPGGYQSAPTVTQAITIGQSAQTFNLVFRDSPAPGDINIAKVDDAGNPLEGVVFRLSKDVAPLATDADVVLGTGDAGTVIGTCTTDAEGVCGFSDVALGSYWIVETTGPGSEYGTASPQHVTMGLGGAAGEGQEKNLTFTNARKHRVIVIVCHEGTDTLVAGSVSLGGGAAVPSLGTAPGNVTESELCGLGGARFNGVGHGTSTVGVTLAAH